jgi:hypothetical protein
MLMKALCGGEELGDEGEGGRESRWFYFEFGGKESRNLKIKRARALLF